MNKTELFNLLNRIVKEVFFDIPESISIGDVDGLGLLFTYIKEKMYRLDQLMLYSRRESRIDKLDWIRVECNEFIERYLEEIGKLKPEDAGYYPSLRKYLLPEDVVAKFLGDRGPRIEKACNLLLGCVEEKVLVRLRLI